MKLFVKWTFAIVLAVLLTGDIYLIAVFLKNKQEISIGNNYKRYDLTLGKPLAINLKELPLKENRKLVVMGHYDFPFEVMRKEGRYEEWSIGVSFEARGIKAKKIDFNRDYVQSGFSENLVEFDPQGVSSLYITLFRLDKVPSDKIQISMGSDYNIDAYTIDSLLPVYIAVLTVLSGIVGGGLLLIHRRKV